MTFREENGFLSSSQTRSVGTEFEELELVDAIDKPSSKDYIFEDIPTNVLSQAESSVMLIQKSMTSLSKIGKLGMRKCRQSIIVQAGHIARLWLVMLFEKSMNQAKAFPTRGG